MKIILRPVDSDSNNQSRGMSVIEVVIVVAIFAVIAQAIRTVVFKLSAGTVKAAHYEEENKIRNIVVSTLISDLRVNDRVETDLTSSGQRRIIIRRPGSVTTLESLDITIPIPNSTYASVTEYVASQQVSSLNAETIVWISDNKSSPSAGSAVIRRQCNASNNCKDTNFGPSAATPHLRGLQLKVESLNNSVITLNLESLITEQNRQNVARRFGFSVDLTKGSTYEILR